LLSAKANQAAGLHIALYSSPEWRQNRRLLLLLLGVAMSRLEPPQLQEEEEDDSKNGDEDGGICHRSPLVREKKVND
jgi:hypothetical protein